MCRGEKLRRSPITGLQGKIGRGAQNRAVTDSGTISVVGRGRAEGVPDLCRATLVATALRSSVAAALQESEAAARRIRAALAAGGVQPQDAATGGMNLRAEEDYSGQHGPRLLGYRAEHTIDVVLRDLAGAGRLLGDAVAAGGEAVRLQGVGFTVEDDAGLRERARSAAWADARRAGKQLASLASAPLGRVVSVDEGTGRGGPPPRPMEARLMAASADMGLEPGAVGVEVQLAVVWELG
jgi:hypothetical protein